MHLRLHHVHRSGARVAGRRDAGRAASQRGRSASRMPSGTSSPRCVEHGVGRHQVADLADEQQRAPAATWYRHPARCTRGPAFMRRLNVRRSSRPSRSSAPASDRASCGSRAPCRRHRPRRPIFEVHDRGDRRLEQHILPAGVARRSGARSIRSRVQPVVPSTRRGRRRRPVAAKAPGSREPGRVPPSQRHHQRAVR